MENYRAPDPAAWQRMMQGAQMLQQAQQPVFAPKPAQQLPQQQRCVSTVYGQQVVTNCN